MTDVSSFYLRISGTAGVSNDTNATFLALYDSVSGQTSISINGNEEFRKNYPSKKSEIEDLAPYDAAVFASSGRVTVSSDPSDSALTVSSFTMVITGRVAYTDNTTKDFSFEIRDDGNVYNHQSVESNEAWLSIAGTGEDTATTTRAVITTVLESLYSDTGDAITVTLTS
jgi:hypothetical protein